jgi:HK97 family phage major capsid protein
MTKIAIPSTQSELEELLGDGAKVQNLMAEGQFTDVVKAYAKHVADTDVELARQVKEETQRVLADYLRENENVEGLELLKKGGVQAVTGSARDFSVFNPKALGASINADDYDGLSGFLKDIKHDAYVDAALAAKRTALKAAAASAGEPASGGFLVPEAFRAELLRLAIEKGVTRPRARIVPMETSRVIYPMLDVTSHATNVFGGVQGYWTAESGQMTDVAASFGRIALEAWKLTAFANVPNELIADSALAFEAFIRSTFPEALAYFEDVAFISGNGAGQPLGWSTDANDARVSVAKESGQAADTIVWENIVKMYARMLPQSLGNAVWIVSPDTFPELATMALSVGTGGGPIWLNNGVEGPPARILGRPVVISEKVENLGDKGDINFVDLSYYLIGDRQALTVESSPHYRFQNGETSYKFVSRVDGRPWLQSALTPRNGGDTLSPFVTLDARA